MARESLEEMAARRNAERLRGAQEKARERGGYIPETLDDLPGRLRPYKSHGGPYTLKWFPNPRRSET